MNIAQEKNFFHTEENKVYGIVCFSSIGDREEQQDCIGYVLKSNSCFVVLCDGMGGHLEGGKASYTAVSEMCKLTEMMKPEMPEGGSGFDRSISKIMSDAADEADRKVTLLSVNEEPEGRAGTTLAAVFLNERNLTWISAGDSRIYISRDGAFARITHDHNYQYLLDSALKNGEITVEEYRQEMRRASALVSFLGIDGLTLKDSNEKPFPVCPGDRILLMTDGLYRLVSDDEINHALQVDPDISTLAARLMEKAEEKAKEDGIKQDNTTLLIIEIK